MKRLCLLMFLVAPVWATAPSYVNSNICGSGSALVSTQTCTLSVTGGNQLFVTAYQATSISSISISDGVNTYTQVGSTGTYMVTWKVVSLATTATITITVTYGTPTTETVVIEQVSGGSTTILTQFDDGTLVGTNIAGSETFQCTGVTTTTADNYIYGVGGQSNPLNNITTMIMNLAINDTGSSQTGIGNRLSFGHQTVATAGTVAPTFSATPNYNSAVLTASCMIIAMAPATSGSVTPRRRRYGQ
jgi:hypothetical protein